MVREPTGVGNKLAAHGGASDVAQRSKARRKGCVIAIFRQHETTFRRTSNSARRAGRDARDRRPRGQSDEPWQGFLALFPSHETRFAAVLRRRRPRTGAASSRPGDGHEALSERRSWKVFLHEARAVAEA